MSFLRIDHLSVTLKPGFRSRSSQNRASLAICSWGISLTSFILLSKSLTYSTASSLFFLTCHFFRTLLQHWCCRTCEVTTRWILDALVLSFLHSLFKGFLTMYWTTSSSLERSESLWTLLTLLGPRQWGTVVAASPGISFSPSFTTNLRIFRVSQCNPKRIWFFSLQFLICNKNVLSQ
jgi:hypothetical protein